MYTKYLEEEEVSRARRSKSIQNRNGKLSLQFLLNLLAGKTRDQWLRGIVLMARSLAIYNNRSRKKHPAPGTLAVRKLYVLAQKLQKLNRRCFWLPAGPLSVASPLPLAAEVTGLAKHRHFYGHRSCRIRRLVFAGHITIIISNHWWSI